MTINELQTRLNDNIFDVTEVDKVKLLLEAINDWPEPVKTLDGYLKKLQLDSRCSNITYEVINKVKSVLNPTTQAWKMESCTSLMVLIQMCNHKSLNEIFYYLENSEKI